MEFSSVYGVRYFRYRSEKESFDAVKRIMPLEEKKKNQRKTERMSDGSLIYTLLLADLKETA